MSKVEESVETLVKDRIEKIGYELYDVLYLKEGSNKILRIVIDKKCAEWLNNPKMCVFLKPHILFGDKFERYLHEDVVLPKRTLKDISYAELDVAIEAEKRKNESS